jgi:hypothetical protein
VIFKQTPNKWSVESWRLLSAAAKRLQGFNLLPAHREVVTRDPTFELPRRLVIGYKGVESSCRRIVFKLAVFLTPEGLLQDLRLEGRTLAGC